MVIIMEDIEIIDLYWSRDESAITQTDIKYGHFCRYIIYEILKNHEDCEEVTNDTYLKTWNTIPPTRPQTLKGYLALLCRQLSFDRYKANKTQKRGAGEITVALDEISEIISDQGSDICEDFALRDALDRFLWSLPKKTRIIFVRRYFYMSPISSIADSLSMKEAAVGMLLHRTRIKLREYLEKEGFAL